MSSRGSAPSCASLGQARPRSFLAWAHLKRGPLALVATARGSHSAQLHNRRPRRRVHLTSQIHNSLTLCRVKRASVTALMDTDKWLPKNPFAIFLYLSPPGPASALPPGRVSLSTLYRIHSRGRGLGLFRKLFDWREIAAASHATLFCNKKEVTYHVE